MLFFLYAHVAHCMSVFIIVGSFAPYIYTLKYIFLMRAVAITFPLFLPQGEFLARCEEEATSRRDGLTMEDMMPPSYSDDEYGGGEVESESDSEPSISVKGGFYCDKQGAGGGRGEGGIGGGGPVTFCCMMVL